MIYGLIPAAGKSRRMGRPKLTLPFGDRTVLQCVLDALRAGGIEKTLVIVGPHVSELVPLATNAGAAVCLLAQETPDMRATVAHGLRWLEAQFTPVPSDAFLLAPADHPTLDPAVICLLLRAVAEHPEKSIFVPTTDGRRGHPTLIGWPHVASILAHPAGEGLNAYLRTHGRETLELPVADSDVLYDLDTPEEYAALLQKWAAQKNHV